MHTAYKNIFKRCGLDFLTIEADPGVMGGNISHEFMVPAASGEDVVLRCPGCKVASGFSEEEKICLKCKVKLEKTSCVEIGHIFKLGTKYSLALEANFVDAQGKLRPVIMGCYGIGVSRLVAAIIEQNNDENGIIWPKEISPFKVVVLALDVADKKIMQEAEDIYNELKAGGIETLLDDRDERPGVKFKDADLLGPPLQVVLGKEFLKSNNLELKIRSSNEKIIKDRLEVFGQIKRILDG
jgi:prolyl-tRNA synthetase